jgi:non-ribosomal peptide synthetase component F
LPVQYADFAVWQRQWLSGDVLEAQLSYWKQQLAGAPHFLDLPTDRPRPPEPSFRGAQEPVHISEGVTEQLRMFCRDERVTLFMALLAAFQVLLFHLTGQSDLLVGTPMAGRTHPEIEGLIGFFVNTLVLRADLSGDPPFRELLRRVRERALEAYAHQDLPFERLVEELQPTRDHTRCPLIQAVFALQNAPTPPVQLAGLTVTPMEIAIPAAKFDLFLSLTEHPDGLRGDLEYSTDLFDPPTITQIRGHFQTLLAEIVADPDQCLSALGAGQQGERRQRLVERPAGNRLAPTGKVERRELPAQEWIRPDREEAAPPRTPVERVLAEIWADLLACDRVGVHDRFFDLGGTSLLAAELVSRVHRDLGMELPSRCLLEAPTVAELALALVQAQLERVSPAERDELLAILDDRGL